MTYPGMVTNSRVQLDYISQLVRDRLLLAICSSFVVFVLLTKHIWEGYFILQVTRPIPVSSRHVTSTLSVKWTSGPGRQSASAMLGISAWMACPVRASVSCRLTFVSMTANATSSLAREPSAGGWQAGIRGSDLRVCAGKSVWVCRFVRLVLHHISRFSSWVHAVSLSLLNLKLVCLGSDLCLFFFFLPINLAGLTNYK